MSECWKVYDKFHQTILREVTLSDEKEMTLLVQNAVNAFNENRQCSQEQRSDWLSQVANLLEEKKEEVTDLIIKEAGKPRDYARVEVERSLQTLRWGSEECKRLSGEVVPFDFANGVGKQAFTQRFPRGVILGISPFNFPLNLALHKIVPALATGNSIIVKPSPFTPLCLLALKELFDQAAVPKGLFQLALCSNDESEKLVTDERIQMLSFTGSPTIGWMLKEKCGKKKVALELGGNAAVYIDESAQLEECAKQLAVGCYLYSGQICISTQRIYVHSNVKEKLQEALLKEIGKLKCGDPDEKGVTVGPLIASEHIKRIDEWIEEAKNGGAEVLCGGAPLKNNIYGPTLLSQTKKGQKVVDEEVFGPVAIIEEVSSFEEGIEKINDSRFGLQAGVFSEKIEHMKYAFKHLDVGGVMMNSVPGLRLDPMPYGGIKDSGLGREGLKYAMNEMTEEKLLVF